MIKHWRDLSLTLCPYSQVESGTYNVSNKLYLARPTEVK